MNELTAVTTVAASAGVSRDGGATASGWVNVQRPATSIPPSNWDPQIFSTGDSSGFWVVWQTHKNYLYGVCLKQMGGVREDAEDALSRAMLKAWDRLPRYADEIENVKAWLTRLVCNLCLDIHRERKIRARNAVNLDDAIAADSKSLAHNAASPEATVLSREICGHINDVVDCLPPRLREPFKLRFFEEMSYRDIAERLALTGDNVRKRIQLARAIMQERLSEYRSPSSPAA